MPIQHGGCHCGLVRYEVSGTPTTVLECNCSICRRKAYLHWIVPSEAFRLLQGADVLRTYRFGTGIAQHRFCGRCGVASFYVPRSHPHGVDVNARCLDTVALDSLTIVPFDGRDWERAAAALRARAP